jgi:four helix bundle protein
VAEVSDFKQLDVWKKGRELVRHVYTTTGRFPGGPRNALANQMQRAAVSVPSNIAEGYGRGTRQAYIHSLRIARGSLCELETQVILARDVGLLGDTAALDVLVRDTHRLLYGLLRALDEPASDGKGQAGER